MAIKNQLKLGEPLKARRRLFIIIGQPNSGKTSLACTAESPLFIDAELGLSRAVGRVIPRRPIQMESFEDVRGIEKSDLDGYKTVVIDTIGKFLEMIEKYVKKNYGSKGWAIYTNIKKEFDDFNNKLMEYGVNVVYTSHAREIETDGKVLIRPILGSQSIKGDILFSADVVGYIDFKEQNSRVLCFDADGLTQSLKNSPNIPTQVVDVQNNRHQMADIISLAVNHFAENDRLRSEETIVISEIEDKISTCNDVDYCNIILGEIQEWKEKDIATSKVLFELLRNKAKEVGFEYNQTEKQFVNKSGENQDAKE